MVPLLVYLCLALIGICLLMMLGFGLTNAGSMIARESKMVLASFLLPVLIFVIAYVVDGTWTGAAVATALAMVLTGFVALIISGARSLFT